jgi:uncharacterized repeat protein (TIGR04076 family)
MRESSETRIGKRVLVRVVNVRGPDGPGTCSYGHVTGDEWELGECCPAGMCVWAFNALFPFATVLRFGGSLPWEEHPGKARVSCPDPDNTVVFELRAVDDPV